MKVNYIEEMITKHIPDFDFSKFEIEKEFVVGYYKGEYVEISLSDYLKFKK
jgi:hypothetical protein